MKKIILAVLLASPLFASAEIIGCNFTEPFVFSAYDTATSTLTYSDFVGNEVVVNDVSFHIKAAGVFELMKNGEVLQHLELNYQGSDGMSDRLYPFDVKDNHEMTHQGWGGCYTETLR